MESLELLEDEDSGGALTLSELVLLDETLLELEVLVLVEVDEELELLGVSATVV